MRTLYFCAVVSSFSIFYLFFIPRLISAVADWMSTILPHVVWPYANLECRSEMCCTRLAGNAGSKKSPKIRHLGTVAQVCRAISSQLRHISTIGWDRFGSLRHLSYISTGFASWQRYWAALYSSGRQPNFAHWTEGPPIFGRAAITLGIDPHF